MGQSVIKFNVTSLVNRAKTIEAEIKDKVNAVVVDAHFDIMKRAIQFTPVKTGFLVSRWVPSSSVEYKNGWAVAVIANDAHYADYVENGTDRMSPRYMLRRAVQAGTPALKAKLKKLGLNK